MATNNSINAPIPFSLANGGTGAALTASNGGLVYSTASAMAILAGTATANQIPLSGASAAPSWSTATYPPTTTINQLLYSSANNTIAGLATVNSAVLTTSSGGVPTWELALPVALGGTGLNTLTAHAILIGEGTSNVSEIVLGAGQVLIGTTSGDPVAAALTAGSNINITSASGTITIAASGVINWNDQTTSSVTVAANNGYYTDNGATLVTYTLPSSIPKGSVIEIAGYSAGGWKLVQAASQSINFGNVVTTSGVSGFLASTNQYDCIRLLCVVANTNFVVLSAQGNIQYN